MKQLIYYHTACQTHRIFNSRYPNYHYQKLFSGDRNDSSATLPNYSLLISREQFFYQASQLWNSLPPELRNIPKIETFKKRLKLTISQTIDPFWWTRCFTSDLVISLLLCFILSSSLTATGQSPVNNSFAKWWIEIEIKIKIPSELLSQETSCSWLNEDVLILKSVLHDRDTPFSLLSNCYCNCYF